MNERRSKLDIIIEILLVCKEGDGACKTNIVYKSNINFNLVEKYLDTLLKHKLLKEKENKYIITDNGRIFLGKAKEVIFLLE